MSKTASDKETTTADHAPPQSLPEVVLVKCPKCRAVYNSVVIDKCPACLGPRADADPESAAAPPAQVEVKPEFPIIAQPAVAGGIIIRVDGGKVFRDMTEADVAEAAEEIGKVSEQHGDVARFLVVAEGNVADLEQRLKDARGLVRTTEIRLLDVGAELATLGRAVRSAKREWNTQITMTVTPQNEVIYTDAKTGIQIGEKRTATVDELKQATNRQAALLSPDAPKEQAQDSGEAGKPKGKKGARKTPDSPNHKADPGEQPVKVSVATAPFNRLTPRRKEDMRKITGTDDEPGFALNWSMSEDGERLSVTIPRRLLAPLRTLAGPTLDFKQDTGAVTAEITE